MGHRWVQFFLLEVLSSAYAADESGLKREGPYRQAHECVHLSGSLQLSHIEGRFELPAIVAVFSPLESRAESSSTLGSGKLLR